MKKEKDTITLRNISLYEPFFFRYKFINKNIIEKTLNISNNPAIDNPYKTSDVVLLHTPSAQSVFGSLEQVSFCLLGIQFLSIDIILEINDKRDIYK